jgi:hypothetical protein
MTKLPHNKKIRLIPELICPPSDNKAPVILLKVSVDKASGRLIPTHIEPYFVRERLIREIWGNG